MAHDHHYQPARERLITLDALRGFAMLGILVPNIVVFSWPISASVDPSVIGPSPWNETAHTITGTVFLGKFMFMFAMLFGAGAVLFDRKTRDAERPRLTDGTALWYRRTGALFAIGMIHAYLFWFGDILTMYALAGLTLIWWVRRVPAIWQVIGGLLLYAATAILFIGFMIMGVWAVQEGHIASDELMGGDNAKETAAYLGSWLDALAIRFQTTLFMQLMFGTLFMPALWGIMTLGMGLTKLGVLTGERSVKWHALLALVLLGVGLPLTFAVHHLISGLQFEEPVPSGFLWQGFAQLVGVPLAIGYSQLIVTIAKTGALRFIAYPLSCVGRLALTNYLMQTLICTTLMYGYGFGRFAKIEYPALFGVVGAVWVVNIVFSMVWVRFFRYGPAEWVWRQITYLGLDKSS